MATEVKSEAHMTGWSFRHITPFVGQSGHDGMGYISDSKGRDILHTGESSLNVRENNEVAALATAAPDLYEALSKMVRRIENQGALYELNLFACDGLLGFAKAALNKANPSPA